MRHRSVEFLVIAALVVACGGTTEGTPEPPTDGGSGESFDDSPCSRAGNMCLDITARHSKTGGTSLCGDLGLNHVEDLSCTDAKDLQGKFHGCEARAPRCLSGKSISVTNEELEHYLGDVPYRPPNAPQKACSQAESRAFFYDVMAQKPYDQLAPDASPACRACVVSSANASSWGPLVQLADPTKGFVNSGACFVLENDLACGHAYQLAETCAAHVCTTECASDANPHLCVEYALSRKGPCASYDAAARAACPRWSKSSLCGSGGPRVLLDYFCGP